MSMDATQLWDRLLEAMQQRIGREDTEIWLSGARALQLDGDVLTLEVSNRYYRDWITDNHLNDMVGEASALRGRPTRIELTTQDAADHTGDHRGTTEQPRAVGVSAGQTFENFVVGECNQFAHAAARAVSDSPADQYNPLFVWGSTGLGKTHLMHAVANHILATDPSSRIVYVTAEDFMNDMINCLRYKRMEDFRDKYRKRASVLLVDDVQFLSGKERTQVEFFHTFNALVNSGRQIVLTADVNPKDIDKLEPRLRTRFEGGLLADISAPDSETLLAILRQKSELQNLSIPPDLAEAIAHQVEGNIRELEGILNRLAALHTFYNQPLTLAFARDKMPNVFRTSPIVLTVPTIIEAVARFHSLRSADITGSKRTRTLTRPRQIAMFLARRYTSLSFPELGREFGGRDHSTIQYGYKKVAKEIKDDADLAYKIKLIESSLKVRNPS
jgi:chromosomal replication initiator protein